MVQSPVEIFPFRNKNPRYIGSLSHYLQDFVHPRWLFGISEPSTVATDFLRGKTGAMNLSITPAVWGCFCNQSINKQLLQKWMATNQQNPIGSADPPRKQKAVGGKAWRFGGGKNR